MINSNVSPEKANQTKYLTELGKSLVGKKAQSRLLTEISANGQKVLSAPQLITGFEIVESFGEPDLMLIIDDQVIFEDLLINIK